MKTLIIESCEKRLTQNSVTSIVHVKNSQLIAATLNADLITHVSEIQNVINNQYDVIICAYGSPYMKYNAYLEILDSNPNAKMFWLVNDHDCEDNILLRKWLQKYDKKYHMICNNPRSGYRGWILRKKMHGLTLNDWIDEWHTINLNAIIFDENLFYKTMFAKKHFDLIYYGTFRKHRVKDMIQFNDCKYFLSTSKKNQIKYLEAGINAQFIEKIQWTESETDLFEPIGFRLMDYKYSIYFEDEHTHLNYAFMANRFYECVMNNTLMFYDAKCLETIKKSNFKISHFQIVIDGKELKEKIEILNSDNDSFNHFLSLQQSNFDLIMKEKNETFNQIKTIIGI
jgi:hypothetical protein